MDNLDRYQALRKGVKALFTKVAEDIKAAREHRGAKLIDEKYRTIDDVFSPSLFHMERPGYEDERERIVDTLIGQWAQAQAIVTCPELLDSDDPDILADMHDMLRRAEAKLADMRGDILDEFARVECKNLEELYGLNEAQCKAYHDLNTAHAFLDDYKQAMRL